jgi:hypothetical protein
MAHSDGMIFTVADVVPEAVYERVKAASETLGNCGANHEVASSNETS